MNEPRRIGPLSPGQLIIGLVVALVLIAAIVLRRRLCNSDQAEIIALPEA